MVTVLSSLRVIFYHMSQKRSVIYLCMVMLSAVMKYIYSTVLRWNILVIVSTYLICVALLQFRERIQHYDIWSQISLEPFRKHFLGCYLKAIKWNHFIQDVYSLHSFLGDILNLNWFCEILMNFLLLFCAFGYNSLIKQFCHIKVLIFNTSYWTHWLLQVQ